MEIKERPTFSVIHDDEFKSLSTDISEKKDIKNNTIDWQDDWSKPPAEEMKHQYRNCEIEKESQTYFEE